MVTAKILLSPYLARVAKLIADGYTSKEIATLTGKTEGTINQYTAKLYRELGIGGSNPGNYRVRLANMIREAA